MFADFGVQGQRTNANVFHDVEEVSFAQFARGLVRVNAANLDEVLQEFAAFFGQATVPNLQPNADEKAR